MKNKQDNTLFILACKTNYDFDAAIIRVSTKRSKLITYMKQLIRRRWRKSGDTESMNAELESMKAAFENANGKIGKWNLPTKRGYMVKQYRLIEAKSI